MNKQGGGDRRNDSEFGRNSRRDGKTYAGNGAKSGMRGAGRRVYTGENGPRVGRVAQNVPAARQVGADGASDVERLPEHARSGGEFHRGSAWRSESGPRGRGAALELPEAPENLLVGRNPIREALKAGRPVEKLLVAAGELSGAAREIVGMAREAGAVVQQVDRARLDEIYPAHQGMLAYVAAVPYVSVEDMLRAAREKGEDPFLILLDGITDPHNLGAIIRTAECAGAHGVVIPQRRAAGLGPAAAKAAAGALSHLPIARVTNLNRTIDELKQAGVWVIGTAMDGEDALSADLTGPVALVIGSEGEGVARLTLEKCDRTVSLPMKGRIVSLNASVAAGILMYEIVRARS